MTENNYSEKSLFDNPQEEKPKKEDSIKLIIKSLQTLNLTGSVPPELLNKNLWELPIPKKTKNLIIKTYKDNNGKDNIKSCFNKTKKLYNIDLPKLAEALYSLDDVYISILEKNEEGQIRATI
ncbi:MAG: hypothetical protein OEL89_05000, partial [Candidatus Peregrinibacteria bacterium]|nr:hypothetical protein [Candidatus Peregrinibacteria bacterium]